MQSYQVVKAKTAKEAISQSDWQVGDAAVCSVVKAVGNSDGTFSVFPTFMKPETQKPRLKSVVKQLNTCHQILEEQ